MYRIGAVLVRQTLRCRLQRERPAESSWYPHRSAWTTLDNLLNGPKRRQILPISVPTPRVLARRACRVASPPEEPPHDKLRLWGLYVVPSIWLTVSPICVRHKRLCRRNDGSAYATTCHHCLRKTRLQDRILAMQPEIWKHFTDLAVKHSSD